jgi:hypothetical protein
MVLCGKGHFERAEGGRMTQRETMIECLQGAETVLIDLGIHNKMPLRSAVVANARINWFILTWIIKQIDKEEKRMTGKEEIVFADFKETVKSTGNSQIYSPIIYRLAEKYDIPLRVVANIIHDGYEKERRTK